jgi:hypothetical protein
VSSCCDHQTSSAAASAAATVPASDDLSYALSDDRSEALSDATGESCCEKPARADWMLWLCVVLVALSLSAQLLQPSFIAGGPLADFFDAVAEFFARMWWGLALGVLFVGVLAGVPRDLVVSVLGRRAGLGGMFRATLAGVCLDLCSHGILAVGMKLYERGASTGQVMAFLLASPWNSFSLRSFCSG